MKAAKSSSQQSIPNRQAMREKVNYRQVCIIVALIAFLLCLTGCSSNSDNSGSSANSGSSVQSDTTTSSLGSSASSKSETIAGSEFEDADFGCKGVFPDGWTQNTEYNQQGYMLWENDAHANALIAYQATDLYKELSDEVKQNMSRKDLDTKSVPKEMAKELGSAGLSTVKDASVKSVDIAGNTYWKVSADGINEVEGKDVKAKRINYMHAGNGYVQQFSLIVYEPEDNVVKACEDDLEECLESVVYTKE